jgi:O-antigen ligase
MTDFFIKWVLILLLVFTPIAFGSQVLWAFSLMELGILLIIILWAIKGLVSSFTHTKGDIQNPQTSNLIPQSSFRLSILLLSLFLGIVLFQMVPLPAGMIKIISPKTYQLRNQLSVTIPITDTKSSLTKSQIRIPKSEISSNPQSSILNPVKSTIGSHPQSSNLKPQSSFTLTLFPLATKVQFFKWLALAGLFIFLLHWRLSDNRYRITNHLIIAIFLVGVFESLYGMFEFFTGHRHVLNLDYSSLINHVTGTFANRNCFAGYLLMVIPLSIGFFLSRETYRYGRFMDWRHRLSSLDGKTLLLGFGLILMILGLILSASRGGIISLLLSFSLMIFLFRNPIGRERFSKISVLIFGLAVLWAAWIGLDVVISRFFSASEDFIGGRWSRWVATFGILKDFPLLGSGLGTFTEVYSMYRSMHIVGLDIQAENDFLQLASEVGLIGIIPLLVLFCFLFFKAASGIRSLSPDEPQRYVGIGGLVGILALMFHSIVQKNLQLPANAFLYTVIWAMVLKIATDSDSERIARKETIEN